MDQRNYFQTVADLLPADDPNLKKIIDSLFSCIQAGNRIWIIGNGGSASTANHFETDLAYVRNNEDPHVIRATSLCANASVLTAIGNDIGFEHVFSHQLMRQAKAGDVCLAISASGRSPNLLKAFEFCTRSSVTKLALLGFDGGDLKNMSDAYLLTPTELGLYGPVEDVQLSICHLIAAELKSKIFTA